MGEKKPNFSGSHQLASIDDLITEKNICTLCNSNGLDESHQSPRLPHPKTLQSTFPPLHPQHLKTHCFLFKCSWGESLSPVAIILNYCLTLSHVIFVLTSLWLEWSDYCPRVSVLLGCPFLGPLAEESRFCSGFISASVGISQLLTFSAPSQECMSPEENPGNLLLSFLKSHGP